MSQVKNLRAMFEGRGDTSPPVDDRGRSSGASTPTPGASGTDSPRPLSKVRTSFVAIEKDGRIGLQRNPSHESNTSRRRLSMDTDAESTSTAPDRPSVGSDDAIRPPKLILHETIPESPRQPPDTGNALEDDALVFDEPVGKLDKKTEQERIDKERIAQETLEREKLQHEKLQQEKVEQEKLKQEKLKQDKVEREKPPLIVEPAPKSPTKAPKPSTTPTPVNGKPKTEKPKAPPATTTTKTTAAKKPTTRPAAISTKPSTIKPPAKSPSAAKTPTSATSKTSSVNAKPSSNPPVKVSASKVHAKPAVKKELPTTKAASSVSRPAASTATKKPQPLKTTTNDTGFVKPKPKSPTKPVHLPASLMAPTASSVSKGASGRGTQLRPSPSVGTLNAPARPISRASASTTGNSTGGKTIKRKDSTIGRSRPSLGPPPKKGNSDASVAKKDAPVDESFLARMMRPTQSSSSKTTEKVPITPPRKTSSRPSLSEAESRRETHSRLGSAKKSARKQEGSSVASDYAGSKETSPSPAVEAATVVATTIATVPVPELPSESTHEPSKVNTTEGSLEAATDADVTLATEPKEAVDGTVSTEKPVQDIANAETEASVNPVQEVDIDVTEVAVKEPVVENDKDVTTDELKVEDDADGATEVEAADEPTITTENVIDNETEESIAVAEPKPAVDESEKTEQAVEVDDEPVITEAAPAATESTEEQDGETETLVKEDALEVLPSPDAGKKADIEEITVENTPVEDKKEESENVPKENSAA